MLPLVIETRPEALALGKEAVRLRPARDLGSLTGDFGELSGDSLPHNWIVEGQNVCTLSGSHQSEVYSQLVFRVVYGGEPWASFM